MSEELTELQECQKELAEVQEDYEAQIRENAAMRRHIQRLEAIHTAGVLAFAGATGQIGKS